MAEEVRAAGRPGRRREGRPPRFSRPQVGLLDALLAAEPQAHGRRRLRAARERAARASRASQPAEARRRVSSASCAPTSATASAGSTSCASSASAAAWPTTWASARRCRCSPCSPAARAREQRRRAVAGRRAALAGLQLEAGGGALRAASCACSTTPAPAAAVTRRRFAGRTTSSLTTYGTLRRDVGCLKEVDVRLRDPRRGAGDQERRQRVRQGRPAAARPHRLALSRHAGREPPGRAVEPVRVPQPRHARRRARLRAAPAEPRDPDPETRALLAPRPAALHPAPHQGAGRQGPAGEARADALLRAGARAAQALRRAARPLPPVAARTRSTSDGHEQAPRSRCSKRCCACARRPAIPGLIDAKLRGRAQRQARRAAAAARRGPSTRGTRRWSSRSSPASWPSCATGSTREGIAYEYLDGKTARPRRRRVERFQNDPELQALPDQPQSRRPRASTSPPPTTSSCSTPGGTRPSKRRPSTAPTASAKEARVRLPPDCRDTVEEKVAACSRPSATWPTPSSTPTTA